MLTDISARPRCPLPLSATLTESEAAAIIQAHYRSYRLRCSNPHVVEFRKWQRRYREEAAAARKMQAWWRSTLRDKGKEGATDKEGTEAGHTTADSEH